MENYGEHFIIALDNKIYSCTAYTSRGKKHMTKSVCGHRRLVGRYGRYLPFVRILTLS